MRDNFLITDKNANLFSFFYINQYKNLHILPIPQVGSTKLVLFVYKRLVLVRDWNFANQNKILIFIF